MRIKPPKKNIPIAPLETKPTTHLKPKNLKLDDFTTEESTTISQTDFKNKPRNSIRKNQKNTRNATAAE